MDKKTWQITAWIGAIIIIVALVWAIQYKQADREINNSPSWESQNDNVGQEPTTDSEKIAYDVWIGTLLASDNSEKGNLLLITANNSIYIKTSRDYNALIGKKVMVSYTGSWQNFVLGDITLVEQD